MAKDILLSNGKVLKANEPIGGANLRWAKRIEEGRFGGNVDWPSYAEVFERPKGSVRPDGKVGAEAVLTLA